MVLETYPGVTLAKDLPPLSSAGLVLRNCAVKATLV